MPLDSEGTFLNKFNNNNIKVFIETGTFIGDGIQSAINAGFEKIYSVELSENLFDVSKTRFLDTTNSKVTNLELKNNINLFLGSSEVELPKIISQISEPFLLWLDAHASGGETVGEHMHTYLIKELTSILEYSEKFEDSVIMIDDMIYYIENPDYAPGFVSEVESLVKQIKPNGEIEYFHAQPWNINTIILVSK